MSVFVTVSNEMYACGRASTTVFGSPTIELTKINFYISESQVRDNAVQISDVSLGQYRSFVIGERNEIYSFGDNENYTLMTGDNENRLQLTLNQVSIDEYLCGVFSVGRNVKICCGDTFTLVYFIEKVDIIEKHFQRLSRIKANGLLVDISIKTI